MQRRKKKTNNKDKDEEALNVEKIRLKYNLLGIIVLVLMGILSFNLGGVGTWISHFLGG